MPRTAPLTVAALSVVSWLAATPALAHGPQPPASWTRVEAGAPVKGIDGRTHVASCSGFPGTDPAFRFWARSGGPAARNLVVYFEGGGSCWDDFSCSFPMGVGSPPGAPQFYVPQVDPAADPAAMQGLFGSDPANPVRDWNILYIPYCTGDLHTGSATRTYDPTGLNPALPGAFRIEHRGFDNFMVALEWARRNLPKPQQVLVAGVSAGGYGATANSPWVAKAFPQAKMAVVADSSQGVTTAGFDFGSPGRGGWNPQLPGWVFGNAAALPGHQLMQRAASAQPKARFAQFTTQLDEVQIGFYAYMKQYYGPGGTCPVVPADWNQQMLGQLAIDAKAPNYRHYLAAGSYHTLLADPPFLSERSAGPLFADWLAAMLEAPGHAHPGKGKGKGPGSGWQDVACPGCLQPLPCP